MSLFRRILLTLWPKRRDDAPIGEVVTPEATRIACVHNTDRVRYTASALDQALTAVQASASLRYTCVVAHAVLTEVVDSDLARFNVSVSDTGC